MPYAVTCKSCGARFSVADDLVQRRLAGKVVTLRCKRCHEPIRINASDPPGRRSSRPPSPAARSPLPQGPARPKPRPPLKARPERHKPPPPHAARLRERDQTPGQANHDLFDTTAAPASNRRFVDVSDMAHSEPPGPNSSTPPLSNLAHGERKGLAHVGEDVDFLLGLSGSPGTAAALQAPSLTDLAREVEAEPPRSRPSAAVAAPPARPTPAAPSATSATSATSAAPKKRMGLVLGLAGLLAAVAVGAQLTTRPTPPAEPGTFAPAAPPAAEPAAMPAEPPPAAAPMASASLVEQPPAEPEPSAPAAAAAKAPTPPPKQTTAPLNASPTPPAATEKAVLQPRPEAAAPGTAFNRAAAASALSNAAAEASACRKDNDPSGVASVTVTFAPSGRVTSAKLSGPPFAGTATGGCIAATLRRAKVPAFDGDLVTVGKTIVVQ